MKKRILATLLAVTLTAAMITGCGSGDGSANGASGETSKESIGESGSGVFYVGETRPELLYGNYVDTNKSKKSSMAMASSDDFKQFMDGMTVIDFDNNGANVRLSAVPWAVSAGRFGYKDDDTTTYSRFNYPSEDELNEMRASLVSKYETEGLTYFNNYIKSIQAPYMCAEFVIESETYMAGSSIAKFSGYYTVSGNTVTLYWDEPDPVTYELKYEKPAISFDFDFDGNGKLILSSQGSKEELTAKALGEGRSFVDKLLINAFVENDSEALDGIVQIDYIEGFSASLLLADGRQTYGTEFAYDMDGNFKLSWKGTADGLDLTEDPKEISGNFLYAYGSGVILTVEGKTYYFTNSETDYFGSSFSNINSEKLDPDKFTKIAAVQKDIKAELMAQFKEAGIKATIDEKTGEVITDDSILFGVDESEISDEGKAYLDTFVGVYIETIKPYIDDGYISKITVEGHTDTSGSYEHNLELSENRATSVKDYCLELYPNMASMIDSKGYSYENPVYGADGEIDMAASRRVVFSFKMSEGNN